MGVSDLEEFEIAQRRHAAAIAADDQLQRLALRATIAADRHDYSYVWRWLGVPVIQMPTDIVAMQEIIWETRPQVVIETGVARGGSVILYASILQLLGEGSVIGIDIDVRSHNRRVIESHPLAHRIELVEGSSVDDRTLEEVRRRIGSASRVMVVLDSDHAHDHVLAELRAYSDLVTPGQFIVVADTMVELLPVQEHRPRHWGPANNPMTALRAFLQEDERFEIDAYTNGKLLMTSNPSGYLRRRDR